MNGNFQSGIGLPWRRTSLVVRTSLLRSSVHCGGSIDGRTTGGCCTLLKDRDGSRGGEEEHEREESLESEHDELIYKIFN